jgi:hypothetical protein
LADYGVPPNPPYVDLWYHSGPGPTHLYVFYDLSILPLPEIKGDSVHLKYSLAVFSIGLWMVIKSRA